ncbi:ATP synthase gamma chain [Alphaproteobacteria bacterium]|nr:ATP synthase gamma chain [Alphaproteobacteria bacterium]
MENLKAIKARIKTVNSIIKATNAMKMVSAVKLARLNNKNKFSSNCSEILANILKKVINEAIYSQKFDSNSWFMRKDGKELILLFSTDQGFCGSFNQNIFNLFKSVLAQNPEAYIEVIGKRAAFIKKDIELEDKFEIKKCASGISDLILDYVINKGVYKVFVVCSEFKNVLQQTPKCFQIFPLRELQESNGKVNYIKIEGKIDKILDEIFYKYLKKFFTGRLTEHLFSELSARVIAMDSSVKNAKTMLEDLGILLNRTRQARITQELTEIVSSVEFVQ